MAFSENMLLNLMVHLLVAVFAHRYYLYNITISISGSGLQTSAGISVEVLPRRLFGASQQAATHHRFGSLWARARGQPGQPLGLL